MALFEGIDSNWNKPTTQSIDLIHGGQEGAKLVPLNAFVDVVTSEDLSDLKKVPHISFTSLSPR